MPVANCNTKYVYDSSDYIRFKKLSAQRRGHGKDPVKETSAPRRHHLQDAGAYADEKDNVIMYETNSYSHMYTKIYLFVRLLYSHLID